MLKDILVGFKENLSGGNLENLVDPNRDPRFGPKFNLEQRPPTEKEKALFERISGSSVAGGSGGRPPRRNEIGSGIDDYSREKEALRNYFASEDLNAVLKTDEHWNQAAIAVRTLSEIGIKLEDYESRLPKDYKLEVLRRSGEFEYVFRDNPNLVRYVKPSGSVVVHRIMHEEHYGKGYAKLGFKIVNKGGDFLEKGIPCLNPNETDYAKHISKAGESNENNQTIYVSASTFKEGLFDDSWGHYNPGDFNLVFHITPRGLNIVDGEKTEANIHALGPGALFESEKSVIGYIDARDIAKVEIFDGKKRIGEITNKKYIKS